MSVQTLFDYERNGPPTIQPRLLPTAWQPASSAASATLANVNLETLNGDVYKSNTTSVVDVGTFLPGGAVTTITLPSSATFLNNNWSVALLPLLPAGALDGTGPWANVTGPSTFQCASGVGAGNVTSYQFIYIATGVVQAPVAAPPPPAPLELTYGTLEKKGPLWSQ